MRCKICQSEFTLNKYHPNQQVCLRPECQRQRQIQNERDWRLKNPDYFKVLDQESVWRQNRQRYTNLWKATHKDYLKEYEQTHKEQRKKYMREYMRNYRQANTVNGGKS